jgi:transposase
MKHKRIKPVFKDYNSQQTMLLPPSLDEKIEENHPVRIVNHIIDTIDLQVLLDQYPGGGAPSYYPRMMLKNWVYGYLRNIYSSRKLEEAIKQNIHFMWLSAMQEPDHNTLNRFRSDNLKGILKEVFTQVVEHLVEAGYVSLKEVYVDGTKIEANANRYTFVWGKSIETNKKRIRRQLQELWEYAQSVAREELQTNQPESFQEIDAEKVSQVINQIDNAIQGKDICKKKRQKLSYAKKNWPKNLEKYELQQKILDGRNSYSKTDEDATFMRMKEDHMGNGQLKPAYNLQLSTNNQFILNYTIEQTTTDTTTLISHLDEYEHLYGQYPEELTADAGFGSEENYEHLENNQIEAFVKYNYFHKEQTQKWKTDPSRQDNLYYNSQQDCFYCPMGQRMNNIGKHKRETSTGFEQTYTRYQAQNCRGCPLLGKCHKQQGNRIIDVNHNLRKHKAKARELLLSEKGLEKRSQRPADVEATFGIIKQNKGFRRFMLRGLDKVEVETGLIAIAHNIAKMCA